MAAVLNFLLFQGAWLACVLGGAQGLPWVGPAAVAAVAAWHLARAGDATSEAGLLLLAAAVGTVFDSALVATGWLVYPSGQWHALMAPYWIIALWVAFATTLNVSLDWLKGRPALCVAFGALGGPLAYFAGSRLGGVSFTEPAAALIALGVGWAVLTPALVAASRRLNGWRGGERRRAPTAATEATHG